MLREQLFNAAKLGIRLTTKIYAFSVSLGFDIFRSFNVALKVDKAIEVVFNIRVRSKGVAVYILG